MIIMFHFYITIRCMWKLNVVLPITCTALLPLFYVYIQYMRYLSMCQKPCHCYHHHHHLPRLLRCVAGVWRTEYERWQVQFWSFPLLGAERSSGSPWLLSHCPTHRPLRQEDTHRCWLLVVWCGHLRARFHTTWWVTLTYVYLWLYICNKLSGFNLSPSRFYSPC